MKVNLTHKEANLVMAILWELANEGAIVLGGNSNPGWRLSEKGRRLGCLVMDKLEDANAAVESKNGKDRDLSGAPKGTLQDARWEK